MKSTVLLFIMILTPALAHAQYKSYKDLYDPKDFSREKTDVYHPALAATLAIIPGLGHVYTREPLRGLSFFGGVAGSAGMIFLGGYLAWTDMTTLSYVFFFSGCAALLTTYSWNIADAVRVSKIKNMSLRDHALTLQVKPFVPMTFADMRRNALGISIQMNF